MSASPPTPRIRRIRPLALLAAAVLLLFGRLQQSAFAHPVSDRAAAPAAATATFTDDFNGPAGSAVDSSKWGYETKTVKAANPGLAVYVTIGTGQSGPDTGLINKAAASGLTVDAWTIMPFDFGGAGQNMGNLTTQAAEAEGLKNAYGYTDDQAYRHSGISSMNGITDNNETVTVADFGTILSYAQAHHLARLTFWSANRDRPCPGGYPNDDTCSGVPQQAWDFTRTFARYGG